MLQIALAMLVRDLGRWYGLVTALAFTAFILTQQPGTFLGVIARTTALVDTMREVDVWVMDPHVRYVDDIQPMVDGALYRVRGVAGVAWAAPYYKGSARVRLADGRVEACELTAVDDATLLGAPPRLVHGTVDALRTPDAVLVDQAGAVRFGGARAVARGAVLELNDARALVAGIFDAPPGFQSVPRVVTTWQRVRRFVPAERRMLSFVLVRVARGHDPAAVAHAIESRTGLRARTAADFSEDTRRFFIGNTGVLLTFYVITAIAVGIGLFLAAQTFRNFVIDHLRHFGALAAMGADHATIRRMVVAQAVVAGLHGTGLGIGGSALTMAAMAGTETAGRLAPWQVGVTTGLMLGVCAGVAALSLRRVRRLEPAAVFRA